MESQTYLQTLEDPKNVGEHERWFDYKEIPMEAKEIEVPGFIQQVFPMYHGVAWFWRKVNITLSMYNKGRILLRFGAVDYKAKVWLNGQLIGEHEGGDTPFTLDATTAIKLTTENMLAIRVLNPTNDLIDGIILKQTPHRNKITPYQTGYDFDYGGILQSVDIISMPDPWISNIFIIPDPSTSKFKISLTINHEEKTSELCNLSIAISQIHDGSIIMKTNKDVQIHTKRTTETIELQLQNPHMWSVEDPFLYRIVAKLRLVNGIEEHEVAVKAGLRDFRFTNGYFRLNGKRIYLKCAHTGNDFPITLHMATNPDLLRRDFYYAKAMGFNMVRFIAGAAYPIQLDLCDELGLLVYEECMASWLLDDSEKMKQRFDGSNGEMIVRDRNHPSVVIWGLLNETPDDPVFKHAVEYLSSLRELDPSRLVLLNSGRWDGNFNIGSLSNPHSSSWECLMGNEDPNYKKVVKKVNSEGGLIPGMGDIHYYPPLPLKSKDIQFFRTVGDGQKHVFLSEHGVGSQNNSVRLIKLYEQYQGSNDLIANTADVKKLEDYQVYLKQTERFLEDWKAFGLEEKCIDPEKFLIASHSIQAQHRKITLNAIRSNPNLVGYSITGLVDQGRSGEGVMCNTFRELKPGMTDILSDAWAPLRWCIFTDPMHGYSGDMFNVEIVLVNEDILPAGKYLTHIKIRGPNNTKILNRTIPLQISNNIDQPLTEKVFTDQIQVIGPPGRYEISVYLEKGAAPVGGRAIFFVGNKTDLSLKNTEVLVWEDGKRLTEWLANNGVRCRKYSEDFNPLTKREIIVIGNLNGQEIPTKLWEIFVAHLYQGCCAVILNYESLKKNSDPLYLLPIEINGRIVKCATWAAGRDDFANNSIVFDRLPNDPLLDPVYYQDLIPEFVFKDQEPPVSEVLAGAIGVGYYPTQDKFPYFSGVHIGLYRVGAGSFILNSFPLMQNLDKHPAADRLILNLIQYAKTQVNKQLESLPKDFNKTLKDLSA
jgi:hypothetical protein